MDFDFDFDLKLEDLEFDNAKSESSRKLKDENLAKIFLDKNEIRISNFSKSKLFVVGEVLRDLKLPQKGEQFRIRTQQRINLISILLKIIDIHKKIDELTIATYTLNQTALKTIGDLLASGKIKKINFMISDSYSFRYPKYYDHLQNVFLAWNKKYKDVHLVFTWSHLKITLIKCGDDYYQHEGSMNYSLNNLAENILFENNKKQYESDYKFLKEIILRKKSKATKVIC